MGTIAKRESLGRAELENLVTLALDEAPVWPSRLFILALITMPSLCYASAFWKPARHLFFIPVLSVIAGAAIFVLAMVQP